MLCDICDLDILIKHLRIQCLILDLKGTVSTNRRYWAFGRSSQAIEDLLNSSDCTLEKLIDEEDFMGELRSLNTRLIQLYSLFEQICSFDYDVVNQLLGYIVVEPSPEDGEGRCFKYFAR